MIADFDGSTSKSNLTYQDAVAEFTDQFTLVLDGAPLASTQTPVKPMLDQATLSRATVNAG